MWWTLSDSKIYAYHHLWAHKTTTASKIEDHCVKCESYRDHELQQKQKWTNYGSSLIHSISLRRFTPRWSPDHDPRLTLPPGPELRLSTLEMALAFPIFTGPQSSFSTSRSIHKARQKEIQPKLDSKWEFPTSLSQELGAQWHQGKEKQITDEKTFAAEGVFLLDEHFGFQSACFLLNSDGPGLCPAQMSRRILNSNMNAQQQASGSTAQACQEAQPLHMPYVPCLSIWFNGRGQTKQWKQVTE